MIGAIIGDIVGSIYEFDNVKRKDFPLFSDKCEFTDDSILSLAVASAILKTNPLPTNVERDKIEALKANVRDEMIRLANAYPNPMGGYGGRFSSWIYSQSHLPYNSCGNGSAMRASACGFAAASLKQAKVLGACSAALTHDHIDGINGACCTAECIYLARTGHSKDQIRDYVNQRYYKLDTTVAELRLYYEFSEICKTTVPPAIICFLESDSFEDAIRNAISIGGDSDTLGAITGGIAEAYYGVPEWIRKEATSYLTDDLKDILDRFEAKYS